MVKAIESQGVTLQMTVGSPTAMQTIGNITDFSGPGGQASVIDVSNLASSFKEKMMGLPDEGQFTFNINFDPDDVTHQSLRSARASRTRCEFLLTLTDANPAKGQFFGYVLGLVISGGVDNVIKGAVTVEIDGGVTWT